MVALDLNLRVSIPTEKGGVPTTQRLSLAPLLDPVFCQKTPEYRQSRQRTTVLTGAELLLSVPLGSALPAYLPGADKARTTNAPTSPLFFSPLVGSFKRGEAGGAVTALVISPVPLPSPP